MATMHRPALPAPRIFSGPRSGRFVIIGFVLAVTAFAALQVNQFSRATSTGYEIEQLRRERAAKQAEIRELEADVASLSSLARVEIEARTRLKLEPATRRMYIAVNQDVPERQTLPTRFLAPEDQTQPGDGGPAWRRLIQLLPFF